MNHDHDPNHSGNIFYWIFYFALLGISEVTGIMKLGGSEFSLPHHGIWYLPQIDELIPKMITGVILAIVALAMNELFKYIKSKI